MSIWRVGLQSFSTLWLGHVACEVSVMMCCNCTRFFMLVGVAITMPLIIAYTAWAYWVFRGKVGDEGYH